MFFFLNVNKPLGLTSHDVVARVRRMLRERGRKDVKVGHAGTLDPLATGVLVVCLGAATRLSEYVMGHDKTYRAAITLGIETATYDAEGDALSTVDASHITREAVEAALAQFIGNIQQIPPIYSAIKQDGKKLYDLARAGQTADLAPRPVTIHSITIDRYTDGTPHPVVTCEIRCSVGTYIRSIAHDLGAALGVGAHLSALERTVSGAFRVEDAVTLEQLADAPEWSSLAVAPLDALYDFPVVDLSEGAWHDISHGRAITSDARDGTLACAVQTGSLRAILRAESGQWLPHKVFLSGQAD